MTNLAPLIAALIAVESGGNPRAIGDHGQSVGVLQITPVMVRDVNRISGKRFQWPDDCFDRSKSIRMAEIYFGQWPDANAETLARRWNGGPTGDRKKATLQYWKKVKQHYKP